MNDAWLKTDTGAYVRLGAYRSIYATGSGTTWNLWMDLNEGGGSVSLNGSYVSESDAEETARRLVRGIDPSTFI
jgi:hypothetical protein